jgi:glycerol-3-phosphate dehydrogenase
LGGADTQVAVIGGGVVGCAVAHALARRGVDALLLEAQSGLALAASGTNSGILHTGFDSPPGTLETNLILRAAVLREELLDELGVEAWRCGAQLIPHDYEQRASVQRLAANAHSNGVEVHLRSDGSLLVPGESVIDPVAFTHALAGAAQAGGATVRLAQRVIGLASGRDGLPAITLESGERVSAAAVVNCAGLHADAVARLAGEEPVVIYPRKGEFLVFSGAKSGPQLERILLPVPSGLSKGVLVFPTIERLIIAGPTAREREDKCDWSVEGDAAELIFARASLIYPALARAERIGAYAGLRPAGRDANYVIERSRTLPRLIHVAAIRSTGLSASLGIAEHVVGMLAHDRAIVPAAARALPGPTRPRFAGPWWERAAAHHAGLPSVAGQP